MGSLSLALFVSFRRESLLVRIDPGRNASETTDIKPLQPFVYYGRYHPRRVRRQYSFVDRMNDDDTMASLFSLVPFDRIGATIGRILGTTLKEIISPEIGKNLMDLVENQAPGLFNSFFTRIYTPNRLPARSSSSSFLGRTDLSASSRNAGPPLSNTSASLLINAMRRAGSK